MTNPPEYTRLLYDLLYGEVSNALIPAKPKRGELQRMITKSHHATIRAERRRKRKAKQARKVDAYETRIPEATRRANSWLHFCGVSKR